MKTWTFAGFVYYGIYDTQIRTNKCSLEIFAILHAYQERQKCQIIKTSVISSSQLWIQELNLLNYKKQKIVAPWKVIRKIEEILLLFEVKLRNARPWLVSTAYMTKVITLEWKSKNIQAVSCQKYCWLCLHCGLRNLTHWVAIHLTNNISQKNCCIILRSFLMVLRRIYRSNCLPWNRFVRF